MLADEAKGMLRLLRRATTSAVEAVVAWRACLTSPQPFVWDAAATDDDAGHANYMMKMQSDVVIPDALRSLVGLDVAAAAEGAEAELHDGASDGRRREWVARRLIRAEGAIQAQVRGAEPSSDEPLLRVAEVDETALRAELAAGLDEPPPPWALVAYRPREHVDS